MRVPGPAHVFPTATSKSEAWRQPPPSRSLDSQPPALPASPQTVIKGADAKQAEELYVVALVGRECAEQLDTAVFFRI
jgi:hypothetical protein